MVMNTNSFILITSDDDPLTKSKAEEAGADGFVIKDANLRNSLMAVLGDIFGPSGTRGSSFTARLRYINPRPPNENFPTKNSAHENSGAPLDLVGISR